jgi:hypothetical protein
LTNSLHVGTFSHPGRLKSEAATTLVAIACMKIRSPGLVRFGFRRAAVARGLVTMGGKLLRDETPTKDAPQIRTSAA